VAKKAFSFCTAPKFATSMHIKQPYDHRRCSTNPDLYTSNWFLRRQKRSWIGFIPGFVVRHPLVGCHWPKGGSLARFLVIFASEGEISLSPIAITLWNLLLDCVRSIAHFWSRFS